MFVIYINYKQNYNNNNILQNIQHKFNIMYVKMFKR